MSWAIPPGIAPRARSGRGTGRGWVARYCSWIVMAPMITLAWALRGDGKQRYQRRVHVQRQAVHGGLTPPRHTVTRARRDTRANDASLFVGRVQQRATGEPSELRGDPVCAPIRDTGDDEMIDPHNGRDPLGERRGAPESRAHVAHPDLVAAVADADGRHSVSRRPSEPIFVVAGAARPASSVGGLL